MGKTLNFNIGVLGHVDSGKTSLVKAISTQASTACFDKNPESRERGITLDLGFSSLKVDTPPPNLAAAGYTGLHLTLVDCPGHASLIRTIIGGAQIIDLMLLVIDLTKGVQTQTAECLVIGEIICTNLLVVINKTDLVEESKREAAVERMKKRLRATLQKTKFGTVDMLAVAARPGGPDCTSGPVGLAGLVERLVTAAAVPIRTAENASQPAVLSVDHCFAVRGAGTVVTGTLLQGRLAVGDTLQLPVAKIQRKVKSIQQFRVGVDAIEAGDRAGVCLTQLDPASLERGVVCSPGAVPLVPALTASLALIPFYKGEVASGAQFHLSLGHETVMARLTLFSGPEEPRPGTEQEFSYQERLERDSPLPAGHRQWVLLELERSVPLLPGCVTIGSRLDTDVNSTSCRLAFHGRPVWWAADREGWARTELPRLKVFKLKSKEGVVERAVNEQEVIVRDLFKRETNMELFSGLAVRLLTGEEGILTGGFGQSGKVKVRVMAGLAADTLARIGTGGKKGRETVAGKPVTAVLTFKRYIFDPDNKKIVKVSRHLPGKMALYDNRLWLLSHIQNSFSSSDDTGICETVLSPETFRQDMTQVAETLGLQQFLPDVLAGQEEVDWPHSPDLKGSSRPRANTALQLQEKLSPKEPDPVVVQWKDPPEPEAAAGSGELFPRKQLRAGEGGDRAVSRLVSQLELLGGVGEQSNPWREYGRWEAAAGRRVEVWPAWSVTPPGPLTICCAREARVREAVGLVCLQYTLEGRQPALFPPVTAFSLGMCEEDGTVDTDFPALEMKESFSKYCFSQLALIRQDDVPDGGSAAAHITLYLPDGTFHLLEVDRSAGLTAGRLLELGLSELQRRQQLGPRSTQAHTFHLEPGDSAGTVLDPNQELDTLTGQTEFYLVRDNSKRVVPQSRETGHPSGLSIEPVTFLEAPLFQSFNVQIISKVRTKIDIHLGISGEKVEVDPQQQPTWSVYRQKAATYDMDNIVSCEVVDRAGEERQVFKMIYLTDSGWRGQEFEGEAVTVDTVVKKVNHLIDMRQTEARKLRKEYLENKEKKKGRRLSLKHYSSAQKPL